MQDAAPGVDRTFSSCPTKSECSRSLHASQCVNPCCQRENSLRDAVRRMRGTNSAGGSCMEKIAGAELLLNCRAISLLAVEPGRHQHVRERLLHGFGIRRHRRLDSLRLAVERELARAAVRQQDSQSVVVRARRSSDRTASSLWAATGAASCRTPAACGSGRGPGTDVRCRHPSTTAGSERDRSG